MQTDIRLQAVKVPVDGVDLSMTTREFIAIALCIWQSYNGDPDTTRVAVCSLVNGKEYERPCLFTDAFGVSMQELQDEGVISASKSTTYNVEQVCKRLEVA